jgi:uncharacterized OB-fold protein
MKITKPEAVRISKAPAMPSAIGWVCPKCGRVWAPKTPSCFDCNLPAMEIIR